MCLFCLVNCKNYYENTYIQDVSKKKNAQK